MKLLPLLLLAFIGCKSQNKNSFYTIDTTTHWVNSNPGDVFEMGLRGDITINDGSVTVAYYYYNDSIWVIHDTARALYFMEKDFIRSFNESWKERREYQAAKDILQYIRTDGIILFGDREKFDKAVIRYQKITSANAH